MITSLLLPFPGAIVLAQATSTASSTTIVAPRPIIIQQSARSGGSSGSSAASPSILQSILQGLGSFAPLIGGLSSLFGGSSSGGCSGCQNSGSSLGKLTQNPDGTYTSDSGQQYRQIQGQYLPVTHTSDGLEMVTLPSGAKILSSADVPIQYSDGSYDSTKYHYNPDTKMYEPLQNITLTDGSPGKYNTVSKEYFDREGDPINTVQFSTNSSEDPNKTDPLPKGFSYVKTSTNNPDNPDEPYTYDVVANGTAEPVSSGTAVPLSTVSPIQNSGGCTDGSCSNGASPNSFFKSYQYSGGCPNGNCSSGASPNFSNKSCLCNGNGRGGGAIILALADEGCSCPLDSGSSDSAPLSQDPGNTTSSDLSSEPLTYTESPLSSSYETLNSNTAQSFPDAQFFPDATNVSSWNVPTYNNGTGVSEGIFGIPSGSQDFSSAFNSELSSYNSSYSADTAPSSQVFNFVPVSSNSLFESNPSGLNLNFSNAYDESLGVTIPQTGGAYQGVNDTNSSTCTECFEWNTLPYPDYSSSDTSVSSDPVPVQDTNSDSGWTTE